MLKFLAANLSHTETPIAPAMAAMLSVRRPTGMLGIKVAPAWHIFTTDGREIVWHNGGTGGYRSFVGFNPKARVGVVVLSNAETPEGVDDIGHHLLDAKVPLYEPPSECKVVQVDPKIFAGYVGYFQLTPNFDIRITQEGNHVFEQATHQRKFVIFPESEMEFFLKVVDAQISFVKNSQGQVTGLVLRQGGCNVRGKKLK